MTSSKKSNASKAGFFGALIGAIAGIFLFSPRSKQNRKDAKNKVSSLERELESKLKAAHLELSKELKSLNAKSKQFTGKAQSEAKSLEDKVNVAIKEIKNLISTLREGDEDVTSQAKKILVDAKTLKSTVAKKAKSKATSSINKVKNAGKK